MSDVAETRHRITRGVIDVHASRRWKRRAIVAVVETERHPCDGEVRGPPPPPLSIPATRIDVST